MSTGRLSGVCKAASTSTSGRFQLIRKTTCSSITIGTVGISYRCLFIILLRYHQVPAYLPPYLPLRTLRWRPRLCSHPLRIVPRNGVGDGDINTSERFIRRRSAMCLLLWLGWLFSQLRMFLYGN